MINGAVCSGIDYRFAMVVTVEGSATMVVGNILLPLSGDTFNEQCFFILMSQYDHGWGMFVNVKKIN